VGRLAVSLGRDDAVALAYGGFVLAYVAGQLDDGAAFVDLALTINPNWAYAWAAILRPTEWRQHRPEIGAAQRRIELSHTRHRLAGVVHAPEERVARGRNAERRGIFRLAE
jgi:hypothetical protein